MERAKKNIITNFDIIKEIRKSHGGQKQRIKHSLIVPIITSFISAIIFWSIFSYFPQKKRHDKIRPKVNQELFEISSQLSWTFKKIMSETLHTSRCFYSNKIVSGQLSKEDIALGLQNKYLMNIDPRITDVNVKHYMVEFGEFLNGRFLNINRSLDELYFFSEFLTTDEIILLEKIKKLVKVQNGSQFIVPFDILYSYYRKLQPIIFDNYPEYIETTEHFDIGLPLTEIDYHLYYSKNYRKCKRALEKAMNNSTANVYKNQMIICEYKLGDKEIAFIILKEYLKKDTLPLIYQRGIIDFAIEHDERVEDWLEENYSKEEIRKMNDLINKERNEKQNFIEKNKYIMEYFSMIKKL